MLIGYPNRSDGGTLSGGSWASGLDLVNLQDRDLSLLARSSDATVANTQFENDLGSRELIRVVGFHHHNLSLNGTVRVRGWSYESTRTDAASYRDEDGVLQSQPASEARHWHYAIANDGTTYRTTLLEGGSTNELTRSEELDHADWTTTNASVTADQANGPDATASLDQITEDSTASAAHEVSQSATLTADKTYAFAVFAKNEDRTWLRLRLGDGTGTSDTWFNLSTGATGTEGTTAGANTTHVRSYIEDWTDAEAGLYRCVIVVTFGNSATSITGTIALADADGSVTYSGDGSSSLYAGFAQLEDQANFASSYINTTTAAASRDDDFLQESDIGFTPADIEAAGGLTVLSEWVELGTAFSGGANQYWRIGGPSVSDTPYLRVDGTATDGVVRTLFDDGSGSLGSTTVATVSLFDHVRARVVLYDKNGGVGTADWRIRLYVSTNGGAEVDGGESPTIGSSLPAAWSANTLTIGAAPDDTLHGFSGHIKHVFAAGEKTLTEMEALEAGDADVFYYTEPYDSQFQSAFPAAYPTGTTLWGEGRDGESLSQRDLDALERIDYTDVLPTQREVQYVSVEIDDTANSDGYVEGGRLTMAPGFVFPHGPSTGAEIAWTTESTSQMTEGGAFLHQQRPRRRIVNVPIQDVAEDKALVQFYEAYRRLGTTEQFLFVWDETDTHHLWRRAFLAVLTELDPLTYPHIGSYTDQAFSIIEEL